MIAIYIPEKYYNEIFYVYYIFFEYWGNIKPVYFKTDQKDSYLQFDNKTVVFKDSFFYKQDHIKSLELKIKNYHFDSEEYQFLFYNNYDDVLEVNNNIIIVNPDIIGSSFFLLSGYESLFNKKDDKYGRLNSSDSIIRKICHKPLVNYYYQLFKKIIHIYLKNIIFKDHVYKVIATHDIDHPNKYYSLNWKYVLKNCLGDLVQRHKNPFIRLIEYYKNYTNDNDPYNTFSQFMQYEKDVKVIYYLYCTESNTFFTNHDNPAYTIKQNNIKQLINFIEKKNLKIGLHAGLGCYNNLKRLKKEISCYTDVFDKHPDHIRFHYLSYSVRKTVDFLEQCGIRYDSTFTFRDIPSFRAGTCYSFPLYNFKKNRISNVIEQPLIFMDSQLLDCKVEKKKKDQILKNIINEVKKFNGNFNYLWHNHRLTSYDEINFYSKLHNSLYGG